MIWYWGWAGTDVMFRPLPKALHQILYHCNHTQYQPLLLHDPNLWYAKLVVCQYYTVETIRGLLVLLTRIIIVWNRTWCNVSVVLKLPLSDTQCYNCEAMVSSHHFMTGEDSYNATETLQANSVLYWPRLPLSLLIIVSNMTHQVLTHSSPLPITPTMSHDTHPPTHPASLAHLYLELIPELIVCYLSSKNSYHNTMQ